MNRRNNENFIPFHYVDNIGIVLEKRYFQKLDRLDKLSLVDVFGKYADKSVEGSIKLYNKEIELLKEASDNHFTMKNRYRLIIGLGDKTVYEVGITLHRNTGLPYIPGSAIKGVARYYAILKFAEILSDDVFSVAKQLDAVLEESTKNDKKSRENLLNRVSDSNMEMEINGKKLKWDDLARIFGTKDNIGSVAFLGGFVASSQKIEKYGDIFELDVMTPHYSEYYTKSKAPGDWYDPVPIPFLVVKPGLHFIFMLSNIRGISQKDDVLNAANLLKMALAELGIGAKTSLGYGLFEEGD